jgi:hypothetical protein
MELQRGKQMDKTKFILNGQSDEDEFEKKLREFNDLCESIKTRKEYKQDLYRKADIIYKECKKIKRELEILEFRQEELEQWFI